jgi:hypothetical protein
VTEKEGAMRQLAIVLIVVAALIFLAGVYTSVFTATVFGKVGVTLWRGAVAFVLFAIAVLQLHTAPKS